MKSTRAVFGLSLGLLLAACGGSSGGGLGLFGMGDGGVVSGAKKDGGSTTGVKKDGGGATSTSDDSGFEEDDGGGTTETQDDGSAASCTLSNGTYEFSAQATASSAGTCPPIADMSGTVSKDGSLTDLITDLMADDPGCTTSMDEATCTASAHCSAVDDGVTTTASLTVTLDGDSATGQETVKVSESGDVVIACTYNLTFTMATKK